MIITVMVLGVPIFWVITLLGLYTIEKIYPGRVGMSMKWRLGLFLFFAILFYSGYDIWQSGRSTSDETESVRHNEDIKGTLVALDCDDCEDEDFSLCPVPGLLLWVQDTQVLYDDPDKALHTLPPNLEVKTSGIPDAGLGVWTLADFPACTLFGPYAGEIIPNEQVSPSRSGEYAWQIVINGKPSHWVDGMKKSHSNWIRYINTADEKIDRNLQAVQSNGEIFYRSVREISAGTELLVWYGIQYSKSLKLKKRKQKSFDELQKYLTEIH